MKLDINKFLSKLSPLLDFLKKYAVFIFVIFMLIIFSFLVFRINQFSKVSPSESDLTDKLKTVQRPKIDQKIVDKILELESQNIKVQSLFEQARNDPFNE